MPLDAFGLALAAAFLHAVWNVLLDRTGTVFGLTIAATIAGYTLIDNSGVTRADPLAYLELVMVGPAMLSALVVGARSGRAALRSGLRLETVLIAPLTLAPYALALF